MKTILLSKSSLILVISLSLLSLSSCRFKVPSIAEQTELARMGAFPNGLPVWASQNAQLNSFPTRNSGPIPTTFSSPSLVDSSSPRGSQQEDKINFARTKIPSTNNTKDKSKLASSPLDRVANTCPGYYDQAEETLLIVDRAKRIEKYEWLVKRCPNSSDIWVWLGRDYKSAGQTEKARNAASRAVAIDKNNKEAVYLLDSF